MTKCTFPDKSLDPETGLYYYGARYLDPKYSMWLSCDPALGEYIPQAPINDEAKKNNQNLPGMGGLFNHVNHNLYHYAGNNPVKYVDPDGRAPIDYAVVEAAAVTVGYCFGGVLGAAVGYAAAKKLEDYNGPQRDAANLAATGENPANPKGDKDYTKLSDSQSAFHQLNDGSKVSKYIKPDENGGTSEIVWNDTKNELVTDPKARGTYNYGKDPVEHGIKDVVPWILLGTGKDDPSIMGERLLDTVKSAPAYLKEKFEKKEVQE